jgi:hypothetical protein
VPIARDGETPENIREFNTIENCSIIGIWSGGYPMEKGFMSAIAQKQYIAAMKPSNVATSRERLTSTGTSPPSPISAR